MSTFRTWLLFLNSPYKCQLVYARGEISLDYAVRMYNFSGTSRLIFCVMYVLWKRIFSQWLRTGFLSMILVIGSKNHLLGFKWWTILAWAELVVEQHYLSITLSLLRKVGASKKVSFECWERIVNCGSCKLMILIIYRMLYSSKDPGTTALFSEEFTTYLQSFIMSPSHC